MFQHVCLTLGMVSFLLNTAVEFVAKASALARLTVVLLTVVPSGLKQVLSVWLWLVPHLPTDHPHPMRLLMLVTAGHFIFLVFAFVALLSFP